MGRTAIVTGSDSGIGEATAVALAEAGCDVGVTWHQDEQGAAVVDRLAEDLGGLDVLVNNAAHRHGRAVPGPDPGGLAPPP